MHGKQLISALRVMCGSLLWGISTNLEYNRCSANVATAVLGTIHTTSILITPGLCSHPESGQNIC